MATYSRGPNMLACPDFMPPFSRSPSLSIACEQKRETRRKGVSKAHCRHETSWCIDANLFEAKRASQELVQRVGSVEVRTIANAKSQTCSLNEGTLWILKSHLGFDFVVPSLLQWNNTLIASIASHGEYFFMLLYRKDR